MARTDIKGIIVELAKYEIKASPETVYNWIHVGRRTVKLGGDTAAAVAQFVDAVGLSELQSGRRGRPVINKAASQPQSTMDVDSTGHQTEIPPTE